MIFLGLPLSKACAFADNFEHGSIDGASAGGVSFELLILEALSAFLFCVPIPCSKAALDGKLSRLADSKNNKK